MLKTSQKLAIINAHQKAAKREYPLWDKWRLWYQSRWGGQGASRAHEAAPLTSIYNTTDDAGSAEMIETNYPYAFVDTMVANVVPPNPALTVIARNEENRDFAKARERLINDTFRQQKVHARLWELCTRASVFPRAFIKTSWDIRKHRPRVRVLDPRFVWFDLGADAWEDIRYLIEVVPLTKEQFLKNVRGPKEKEGYDPAVAEKVKAFTKGYPEWLKDKSTDKNDVVDPARDVFEYIIVYEVYDFTVLGGRFSQIVEGVDEALFEGELPYRFIGNPFSMLTFNDNLDDLGGMSDIQLVEGLINQANELDVLDLNFVKSSLPVAFVNVGLLKDPESTLQAYGNAGEPGAYVALQTNGGAHIPLSEIVTFSPTPTLNPAHMRLENRLEDKILFILATPKYSRGSVGTSDVATELALADGATRTRNARRQGTVYDIVGWLGEAVIALYEEYLESTAVLYTRVTGDPKIHELTRDAMGMLTLGADGEYTDTRLEFDYEAVPYSAMENNKTVQLKNIQQLWPVIQFGIQSGDIDKKKIITKLMETVQMEDVLSDGQTAPPAALPTEPNAEEPVQPGQPASAGFDPLAVPNLAAPVGGGAMGTNRADTTPYMTEGGPGHGGGA